MTRKNISRGWHTRGRAKRPAKKIPGIKGLRITLFGLCGAFFLAAAILFLIEWNEGETASQKAELLLEAGGIKPPAATLTAAETQSATQAVDETVDETVDEAADEAVDEAADEAESTLPAELKGYSVIARLDIDVLDLHLPVLPETTKEALKTSVCYYAGPAPGGEGNLVITGHNYRSGAHFGTLDKMTVGDKIIVTDREGNTYPYTVYKLVHIKPDDAGALDDTQYSRELSLLTCEASGNGRLLVRCRMDHK